MFKGERLKNTPLPPSYSKKGVGEASCGKTPNPKTNCRFFDLLLKVYLFDSIIYLPTYLHKIS